MVGLSGLGDVRITGTGVVDDADVLVKVDGVHFAELPRAGNGLENAHGHGSFFIPICAGCRPGMVDLYVPFGKCLSDVDKIAFSAFRTRFSASEYTYTTPPKIQEKVVVPQRLFMA